MPSLFEPVEHAAPRALAQFATASLMWLSVVRGSARGTGLDGEGVCLGVLGSRGSDAAVAARDALAAAATELGWSRASQQFEG